MRSGTPEQKSSPGQDIPARGIFMLLCGSLDRLRFAEGIRRHRLK